MRVKRSHVFETNSSSVHTLCIVKEYNNPIPSKLVFNRGLFGWGPATFTDINDRLSYLYENLLGINDLDKRNKYIDRLKKCLDSINVSYEFECEKDPDKEKDDDWHYGIDHPEDSEELVIKPLFDGKDETLLDRFLFGEGSCVLCDNDNAYDRERIAPPDGYKYDFIHR